MRGAQAAGRLAPPPEVVKTGRTHRPEAGERGAAAVSLATERHGTLDGAIARRYNGATHSGAAICPIFETGPAAC